MPAALTTGIIGCSKKPFEPRNEWIKLLEEGKENVFTGQSKIYTYMSPNKCSGMRSPLQEENSVAHHEVKCQGKPLAGIYRKREEKRNAGNAIRSTMKSEELKIKDARRGPLAPFPNQKSEVAEPPKTPTSSCDSSGAAIAKQALKKPVKGKQAPRKKAQGKTQQNRKLTDFYPVRRSSRKSKTELQFEERRRLDELIESGKEEGMKFEERRRLDELIESGKEEGMKIDLIDGKGRGVIATKQFSRGDFVVEYHGDLIEITDAKKREALYAQDPSTGCYMYYFQYLSKTYWPPEPASHRGTCGCYELTLSVITQQIDLIDGKGRGVIATKQFSRGDFVVEYHGDLIEITDAKKREALYAQDPSTGCYMYYFQYLSKTYCVDATRETNRLGRLINHSKCGNCQTKLHDIDGVPHLILIASRDIEAGEELLYDYGDRSRASIEAYPWLKH
ncbi:N-lysine methyltransferase SETD8 [Myotis davidii]|uniref:N-lysine methyltransferase KMT5A n=1 Tax=Myotis davidii TaxID=225400 RepID=L5LLK6_MYODS|nr:N-lysine methyltransferase SETD8 [Myotis davidii]